jgi:hypothetical protein
VVADESLDAKKPKRWRKWLISGIVTSVLVIVAISIVRMGNAPAEGRVVQSNQSEASTQTRQSDKTLETDFYTLSYPGEYEPQENPSKGAGQVDLQVLVQHLQKGGFSSIRASLGIEVLPVGGVQEMSPYKLYKAFPHQYKLVSKQLGTDMGYIAEKYDDGTLKTVLWPHEGKVLVIAMSSQTTGNTPDFDRFIDKVIASLVWK